MSTMIDVLREYGNAVESEQISGDQIHAGIDQIAENIEMDGLEPLNDFHLSMIRSALDLCPAGHGHWTSSCTTFCE